MLEVIALGASLVAVGTSAFAVWRTRGAQSKPKAAAYQRRPVEALRGGAAPTFADKRPDVAELTLSADALAAALDAAGDAGRAYDTRARGGQYRVTVAADRG